MPPRRSDERHGGARAFGVTQPT